MSRSPRRNWQASNNGSCGTGAPRPSDFGPLPIRLPIIGSRILPKANEALRLVQTGFEQGKFGFIDLLDTQRTTAEVRLTYQQKLLELNVAQAELEALLGGTRRTQIRTRHPVPKRNHKHTIYETIAQRQIHYPLVSRRPGARRGMLQTTSPPTTARQRRKSPPSTPLRERNVHGTRLAGGRMRHLPPGTRRQVEARRGIQSATACRGFCRPGRGGDRGRHYSERFPKAVECYAELAFNQNKLAQIAAPVGGIIQEVRATSGSKVEEKQTVANIWSASIAEAVAKAVLTHQTLERERKLRADRVSSEKDLQQAEADHRAACQQAAHVRVQRGRH